MFSSSTWTRRVTWQRALASLQWNLNRKISAVLDRRVRIEDILRQVRPGVDLAPANIRLSYIEASLFTKHRREDRLKSALTSIASGYDFTLIDCPPSLGILTVNALSAADQVLIPMACEYFAMLGVELLLTTIDEMRVEINPGLSIRGLLPTRYARTVNAREILAHTIETLADRVQVFEPPVPETVKFREAAALGKTIFEHDPTSPGGDAYRALAEAVARG